MTEIFYISVLVLWIVSLFVQQKIINSQRELIEMQEGIIQGQEIKSSLQDILIKEQRELTDMQREFIKKYIIDESASKAYYQTLKERTEKC